MIISDDKYLQAVDRLFCSAELPESTLGTVVSYFAEGGELKVSAAMKRAEYSAQELFEFSVQLFSLNSAVALGRTIHFFLATEKYEQLYILMRGSPISDAFSGVDYQSTKHDYTFEERAFDRFIRILYTVGTPEEEYCHFIFYLADSTAHAWNRPAREFLYHLNIKLLFSHASKHRSAAVLAVLLERDTEKATKMLVDLIVDGTGDRTRFFSLLTPYKRFAAPLAISKLGESVNYSREQAVKILLLYKKDESILERLESFYQSEPTERIRSIIANELGYSEQHLSIKSFSDLSDYARSVSLSVPRDFPPLQYINGSEVSTEVAGALMGILSDARCRLPRLLDAREISKYITPQSLLSAAKRLYPTADYGRLAFSLLYGDEEIAKSEACRQSDTLGGDSFNSRKLMMLGLSDSRAAREFLYQIGKAPEHKRIHKHAHAGLELASLTSGMSLAEIEDECAPAFGFGDDGRFLTESGFIVITAELKTEINHKNHFQISEQVKSLVAQVAEEIKYQAKRFELAMIEGRKFNHQLFVKNIVGHPILNKIASTLFWGEYRYGKLKNIFIIEGCVRGLDNKPYKLNPECDIMVCHSLDLEEYFGQRKLNVVQPFVQAGRECYTPTQEEIGSGFVNRFSSFLINSNELLKRTKAVGFGAESDEGGSVAHFTKQYADVIAKVGVVGVGSSAVTLGEMRFYNASDFKTPKALAKRIQPMQISAVNKRLFSEFVRDLGKIVNKGNS